VADVTVYRSPPPPRGGKDAAPPFSPSHGKKRTDPCSDQRRRGKDLKNPNPNPRRKLREEEKEGLSALEP